MLLLLVCLTQAMTVSADVMCSSLKHMHIALETHYSISRATLKITDTDRRMWFFITLRGTQKLALP